MSRSSGSALDPRPAACRGVVLLTSDVSMRRRAHDVGVPTALWEEVERGLGSSGGGGSSGGHVVLDASALEASMGKATQSLLRGWQRESALPSATAVAVSGVGSRKKDGESGGSSAPHAVATGSAPIAAAPPAETAAEPSSSASPAIPANLMGRNALGELKQAATTVSNLVGALAAVLAAHGCSGANGAGGPCAVCAAAAEAVVGAQAQAKDWVDFYMHKQREASSNPVLSRMK